MTYPVCKLTGVRAFDLKDSVNGKAVQLAGLACVMFWVGLLSPSGAQAAPIAFARCDTAQVVVPAPGLECGSLEVPSDPEDASLGSMSLAVQRVAPTAPQVGTIVLLAGGPGQPALPPFEMLLAPLARMPALRGYELVSFDQRGTGQSGALSCPAMLREGLAALAGCGATLGAARADYTSQDSVDDLDALREALGGSPLSLYAVSYGGKLAGMYAREYPAGVARMVLDSPVPLDGTDGLDSQRPRALHRVLDAEICRDGACRLFARDPYSDLTRLLAALRRHPMRARIFNSRGRRETVSLSEDAIYQLISVTDLSQDVRAVVPAAIADAIKGDAAPLARLTSGLGDTSQPGARAGATLAAGLFRGAGLSADGAGGGAASSEAASRIAVSLTLFAATACDESQLPWSPESQPATRAATLREWISQLPAGLTAPFTPQAAMSTSKILLCEQWPATPPAPPVPIGVSATPTLILSGDEDLREPYEQDLTVASGYSNVQLLRIPDTGHSTVSADTTGCAQSAMIAFLTGGQTPSSCPTPHEDQVLAPPPSSLSQLRPARSSSTLAGRGAAAVALSIEEVLGQPDSGSGGLHGGSWQLQGTRLVFKGLSDVPGVSLTGSLPLAGLTAQLKIHGLVNGIVKLHGRAISGRLNGAEIHAELAH